MIITIDGPVATGKSTIARHLAEQLGFIYYDTGAMYRAFTYALMQAGVFVDDEHSLIAFLETFHFTLRMRQGQVHYYVGEQEITEEIRSQAVTLNVSKVAANQRVRDKLVALQRELAKGVNSVFEGRDMGTVVFPNAALKIFLTGDPTVRAQRRLEELRRERPEEARKLTLEQMQQQICERDRFDSTRAISPLTQAPDAFVIDTSKATVDELIFQILECKDQLKQRK